MVRLADEDVAAMAAAELSAPPPAEAELAPEDAAPAPEAAPEEPAPAEAPAAEAAPAAAEPRRRQPRPRRSRRTRGCTGARRRACRRARPVDGGRPGGRAGCRRESVESAPSNVVSPAPTSRAGSPQAAATKPAPAAKPKPAAATKKWVVKRAAAPPAKAPEVEIEHGGEPTIWLNRSLPDPTPASARLARPFAKRLVATSKRHGADWAAVLGVLRAQGERGSVPASARELDTLAARMAGTDAWKGALALSGRTGFADRAAAFADLYRFVGVEALVRGYNASKGRLAQKVLSTPGILIYGGGRSDIMMGRIDVRVVVLIGYLAERHGSVTVSSLFSGHRKFARPGVVSAHIYGHAVDVAAVGGTPIAGHQQPGGLTEAAVRSVLLLPGELQPQQVISLLGLGGPSFPMRDHGDHIHVGF